MVGTTKFLFLHANLLYLQCCWYPGISALPCWRSCAGCILHLFRHCTTLWQGCSTSARISTTTRNSKKRFHVSAVTTDVRVTHAGLKAFLLCPCWNTVYPKGPTDFSRAFPRISHWVTMSKCSICPSFSTGLVGLLVLLLWVRSPSTDVRSEPGSQFECPRHAAVQPGRLGASVSGAKHPSTRFQDQGRQLHLLILAPNETPTGEFN